MLRRVRVGLLLLSLLVLTGCNLFLRGGQGELALSITDAPVNDLTQVVVPITSVEVQRDGRWETISSFAVPLEVDLLQLRFDEALLGQKSLDPGVYSQIRLMVAGGKGYVRLPDGSTADLKVPSGAQTGLKISHTFEIKAGELTSLIMDVNVLKFVNRLGGPQGQGGLNEYIMSPTAIRVVDRMTSGTVSGWVGSDEETPLTDAVLSLWDGNKLVAETLPLAEDTKDRVAGEFRFNAIPAGEYDLKVEAGSLTYEAKVVVQAQKDLDLGKIIVE